MNADAAERTLFADTLVCDDEFPFALRVAASRYALADAARRAETTLRAMSCLDDARCDEEEKDNVPPRVEAKIDLALSMLAVLASHGQAIPPAQAVRWSRHGFRVRTDGALAPETSGILSVFLLAGLPLPIDLPVQVLACVADAGGAELWLQVPDSPLALRAALERELFRRHRRLVHERRVALR